MCQSIPTQKRSLDPLVFPHHLRYRIRQWSTRCDNSTWSFYFNAFSISLRILSAARAGSEAEQIAETTARQSAPAVITANALSLFIPPIATSGFAQSDLILRTPSKPHSVTVSVLVGVENTGLMPK